MCLIEFVKPGFSSSFFFICGTKTIPKDIYKMPKRYDKIAINKSKKNPIHNQDNKKSKFHFFMLC